MRGKSGFGILSVLVLASGAAGASPDKKIAIAKTVGSKAGARWAPAVKPKMLSGNVKRALAWLAKHQQPSGGWGQGEESQEMGRSLSLKDKPSVADTCAATLALMRSGNTAKEGEYSGNVRRAIAFLCSEVEESDSKSLAVTRTQGTRVQGKLGPYIDTFMTSMVLAEAKGQMEDARSEKRVVSALNKVMDKIARNQKQDGTWDQNGWAPALSQAMASKGINRAAQNGVKVKEEVRTRAEGYARRQYDKKSGGFGGAGSAGVALYAGASSLGAMQDSFNTRSEDSEKLKVAAKSARTPAERKSAQQKLSEMAAARQDLDQARNSLVRKLDDPSFIAGFGSNGGEEFLSYMNIGETLVVKGGKEWTNWDRSITANLNRVQNQDGSWTGHHCITGRTFCTAAALLALTVDRAPVPISQKMARR